MTNDEMKSQEVSQTSAVEPAKVPVVFAPVKGRSWFSPWLIVAILALSLAGWQWMETRLKLAEMQQEVARRLSGVDATASKSDMLVRQTQTQLVTLQEKLDGLGEKLAESENQQETLRSLYQNLVHSYDESALTEVEQGVTLASQQLQLAGNIQGAVLALQIADVRLAESGQAQYIPLRKVIARDLDRLQLLPQVDLPGMYIRLESVIEAMNTMPLGVAGLVRGENQPVNSSEPQPSIFSAEYWRSLLTVGYWRKLGTDLRSEMRSLVRVQRIDRTEPGLLPPGQDFFLRENLRLRLLNARLALFERDQQIFRNELDRCSDWIKRYFDGDDKVVQNNLETLKQLAATEISIDLPNLNESLSAIRRFRAERERWQGGVKNTKVSSDTNDSEESE